MNPREPQQNYQPPVTPQPPVLTGPEQPQTVIIETPRKNHKKLALWLMIGPSALFILAILFYAISNFVFNNAQPADGEMFTPTSPLQTIFNILFFLCGMVSILTWLPGLIVGIVLLAKSK